MRARRWRQGVISLLSVGAVAVASLVWSQTALAASSASTSLPFTPATRPKPSNEPLYLPTASPWLPLTNAPPAGFFPGSMMVMTDGTVLIHEDNTRTWEKLTPSSTGSYANGTWSAVASMPSGYQPEYYASQILPTGQLLVDGGEYNGSNTEVWTTLGAIYNPITNTWASVSPPTGWLNTGDAQSEMLPTASGGVWTSGIFMLAHPFADGSSGSTGMDDALFNTNGTWTKIPGTGKLDPNDEEGWTLLPNDRVLTVDIEHNWNGSDGGTCSPCTSELFNPLNDTWSATGNVPVDLPSYVGPSGPSEEMGPVVMRPNGLAFAIGGNDATATYNSVTGTWTAGPTLSGNQDSADGAASILPDGNVLFDASPGVFNSPTHFFVWNGSTITQVADTADASSDSSYVTRFVVLPTGQVMFDDGSGDIEIFNADQTANSSWAPTITSVSSTTLKGGSTYSLNGTQLSGRSEGAAYGDDNQSATNYPLVRITNNATHVVTYARTSGFSYAIASGAQSATSFTLPSSTPLGASTLQAVANGIPSAGLAVNITAVSVTSPGSQTTAVGAAASLQIHASDSDGGTLSYSATGLPAGLSIGATTGQITGTPTTTGTYTATVTVADSKGSPSNATSFTWTISAVSVTHPFPQTTAVGAAASLQIHASDSDGGTLSYSATGLPAGLSIGATTGQITGTPTTTGTYTATVTVADSKGSPSNATSFTWAISAVSVTHPFPQTTAVGAAASLQIHASDSDGGTLSYSATGLPAGLSIGATTGQITGTPTTTGTYTAKVTVADSKGSPSNATSFTWTITAVSVTNPGSQTTAVGAAASLQIHASDSDGGTLSYSATGLPAGLSIGATTGQITGTPTTTGTYTVKVTVADSKGSPSNATSFTWTITV